MPADRLPRAARVVMDPLLYAGIIVCNTCGRRGYPVEAGWIAEDLLVATFDRPCWHERQPQVTKLVTPSKLELAKPAPGQCQGIIASGARQGQRCTRLARPGAEYCASHQRQAGA